MMTIKIYLAESGRIADLHKDFPLYQHQYQNKLLNVYVPTSILAPQFTTLNAEEQTIGEYVAGTSVKIGMRYLTRSGEIKVSESRYMRYLKTLTYQGVEYALFERKLPKEFTLYSGQGENAPVLVINVENIETDTEPSQILSLITSQTCSLDVMPSSNLDNDETIEPSELDTVNARLNAIDDVLLDKQDKHDTNIDQDGVLVGANQEVVASLNALNTQVGDNITTLEQQAQDIADLSNRVNNLAGSEVKIGQMNVTALPSVEQLDAFVNLVASRDPENGDTIIVVLNQDGVFTTYKYYYTYNGWENYQMSVEAKAENDIAGLVEGTEGIVGYNQPISANIVNGQIVNVKYKDSNGVYQQVGNAIDSNKGNITNIINGTQVVGEAVKATEDSNGDNIAQTYAKANNVYTKSQSDSKYLPKAYTNVYYYSADGLVDDIPTEPADGVQFTANVPAVGEVKLAEASRVLENAYHFTKNSTDESRIWLVTDTDTTIQLRLLTYVTVEGVSTLLASQLTSDIEFTANQPQEVILDSIYNALQNNEIDVEAGETFTKELYVTSTDNTATTVDLISSQQYASSFNLAVQSIVFNINTINGIKSVSIESTDWTDNGDGTYSVTIPQTQHQQAPTNRYMLNLQQEVSSGVYEYIAFTPEVDIDGNITITSDSAINCVLLIASAVQSNSRGVLELTNPTELSIDYNQVGVLRVEQNETATPLTLNNPSDTGLYYTFIVTNKSDSTEAIEVNGETIAVGQAKQFMWVGEWVLGISPATTGDIYDNFNQQNLNTTLNDLQSEINGKQDTLTFDNTPTQDSSNPVTSGGVYAALSGKEDKTNKVTSIDANSTDTQYPSAKCVYDIVGNIVSLMEVL